MKSELPRCINLAGMHNITEETLIPAVVSQIFPILTSLALCTLGVMGCQYENNRYVNDKGNEIAGQRIYILTKDKKMQKYLICKLGNKDAGSYYYIELQTGYVIKYNDLEYKYLGEKSGWQLVGSSKIKDFIKSLIVSGANNILESSIGDLATSMIQSRKTNHYTSIPIQPSDSTVKLAIFKSDSNNFILDIQDNQEVSLELNLAEKKQLNINHKLFVYGPKVKQIKLIAPDYALIYKDGYPIEADNIIIMPKSGVIHLHVVSLQSNKLYINLS